MSIVLAGGTGVIGQALLDHAGNAHDIITVGRRPTERAAHEIVADFTNLPALPPAETAICVLGTTIGKAALGRLFTRSTTARSCPSRRQPEQRVLASSSSSRPSAPIHLQPYFIPE